MDTPEGRRQLADVGLPEGVRRRVAGLRREEVAAMAGVGLTRYTMLESGTAMNVSEETLSAIACALRLSASETEYLKRLAATDDGKRWRGQLSNITYRALAAIEWAPAYIISLQWVVVGWNRAMSVVWGIEPPGGEPFNIIERNFRDPQFRAMHGERFEQFARSVVAMVRSTTVSHLHDAEFVETLNELRTDSTFASAWDAYDVLHPQNSISTVVESKLVGTFAYQTLSMEVPNEGGHFLVMQVPEEASADALASGA